MIVFFRARPKTPPSYEFVENWKLIFCRNSSKLKREPFCQSIAKLFRNGNFLIFFMGFTFLWSIYFTIGTELSKITGPFGFTTVQNAVCGVTVVIVGTISSVIFSRVISKTHKFKLAHVSLTIASLILIIITYFILKTEIFWLSVIFVGLFGFTLVPNLPLAY